MAEPAAEVLVDEPRAGRVFAAQRRVRFGDVHPAGRARLDALAEYVQDVAGDDTAHAQTEHGFTMDLVWIVRRAVFEVHVAPRFHDELELRTWCSGLGRRWAERRVTMRGAHDDARSRDGGTARARAHVEAGLLWVPLAPRTNRPVALPPEYVEVIAPSAGGRAVSAGFRHASGPDASHEVTAMPWPLRVTDFDLLQHVNNAAGWGMVEEVMSDLHRRASFRAEIEYRTPIERGATVRLDIDRTAPDCFDLWARGAQAGAAEGREAVFFTARVRPL